MTYFFCLHMQTDNLPSFLSKKDAEETSHVQVVYQSRVTEDKSPGSVFGKSPALLRKLFGVDGKQIAYSTDSLSSSGDLEELCGSQHSPLGGSPMLVPSRWKGEQSRFGQTSTQELLVDPVSPESKSSKIASLNESSTTLSPTQSMMSTLKGSPHTSKSSMLSSTSESHLFVDKSLSPSDPNVARRKKQKVSSPLCHNNVVSLQAAISRDEPSVAMHAIHESLVAMHGPSVAMNGDSLPSGSTRGNSRQQVAEGQKMRNQLPTGRRPLNDTASTSTWRSASSLPAGILHEDTSPRRSQSMDFDKTVGGATQSPGVFQKAPRSTLSIESLHSLSSSTPEGSPTCVRKVTADLYILNRRSNFHQHLLLACEERLLVSGCLSHDHDPDHDIAQVPILLICNSSSFCKTHCVLCA